MGIRFSCHGCAKPLNIKNELAGRRGVCPECSTKFRIPLADAEFSTPIAESGAVVAKTMPKVERSVSVPDEVLAVGKDAVATSTPAPLPAATVVEGERTASVPLPSPGLDLELLAGDASAIWYVRPPSGGQYGPATADMLKSWISEGRVARTALLWKDGWPQWREASEALPEIADSLPGTMAGESDDPFSDGRGASNVTTPLAREKTSRIRSDLNGNAKIGAVRRKRSSRRITLVAVLATLVVGLIVTLLLVATTRG